MALCSGAILNSKITKEKPLNAKNMAHKKDTVYSMRVQIRRQGVTLFNTSAGNKGLGRPKFLAALRMSTNDYKSAMNIDFVVTNKF